MAEVKSGGGGFEVSRQPTLASKFWKWCSPVFEDISSLTSKRSNFRFDSARAEIGHEWDLDAMLNGTGGIEKRKVSALTDGWVSMRWIPIKNVSR